MSEQPPLELIATLERLGLASAHQVAQMARRVRRLSRDLPKFDSVWVDALAQSRLLTPFQAAELNAGRSEALRVGPYVLCDRLPYPCYASAYRAKHIESQATVHLTVVEHSEFRLGDLLREFDAFAARLGAFSEVFGAPNSPLTVATDIGLEGSRLFVGSPWVDGRTAAEWIVHHGRFRAEAVMEIARSMLAALSALECCGVCHGDISMSNLMLTDEGKAVLILPGLRGVLRPEEGYARADLPPDAYDNLAPERISRGTPPDILSDIYACGCVWWHLLCGRAPRGGGSSLAKLRAAQAEEICEVRRHAFDVPPTLAAAISACLERDPSRRPHSIAQLAAMLGPSTRGGKEALADCLAKAGRPTVRWSTTIRSVQRSTRTPLWFAGAVCCLATVIAVAWPMLRNRTNPDTVAAAAAPHIAESNALPDEAERRVEQDNGVFERLEASPRQGTSAANLSVHRRNSDNTNVVPANYTDAETEPQDMVLSAEQPVEAASLHLRAGQRVRAASGRRAVLLAPSDGFVVADENVRFENIDFVWNQPLTANPNTTETPAILRLLAGRVEFRGCSFRCVGSVPGAVAAIRWQHPGKTEDAAATLPSGRIRFFDCVLHRVGVGIDCRTIGARSIELSNTLHSDSGPLVQLDRCPQTDEPMALTFSQLTLRDSGPLLECRVSCDEPRAGSLAILATASVLAPRTAEPLVRIRGNSLPDRLLAELRWTGQGCLVTPQTPIVAHDNGKVRDRIVDESGLSIAGLVRSEVGFAGAKSDPADCRAVRWQAPLQSANPPGIDPAALPPNG